MSLRADSIHANRPCLTTDDGANARTRSRNVKTTGPKVSGKDL